MLPEQTETPRPPDDAIRTDTLESPAGEDRLLRPIKVRELYGVAPSTLRSWAQAGLIKAAQRTAGGHRRYRESEVRSLLAELESVA
jgi:hypothetical protein